MPIRDSKMLLNSAVDGLTTTAGTNSTYEVKFATANPNCAKSGKFGCHIIINEGYTDVNSGADFNLWHGAASGPNTPLITRRLTKVQLAKLGGHYFIPFPPTNLQYIRLNTDPVSETSTAGTHTAYLGPDQDGTE